MEPYDTIEYRGFNINIHYDELDENSREWDNLGTIVCQHRNYNLGDDNPDDIKRYLIHLLNPQSTFADGHYQSSTIIELVQLLTKKGFIFLPIYLYDHSGITIRTYPFDCRWDSGQVGFIYISPENLKKEKVTKKKAIEIMEGEIKTLDQYLRGEIYGYEIEPTDRNKEIECNDSCWGFYQTDYMIEEAKSNIDYAISEYRKKIKENKKRRVELNLFMNNCWAY